ncbi:MAG: group 1 truncated hemoglobin [Pseudomonadota bacterium]
MSCPFQRCGGFARLRTVVAAFYDRVLDSDIAGPYFEEANMMALMDHQTRFVAEVMGGPAETSNQRLRAAHGRLRIDRAAFDAVVGLLQQTLIDHELAAEDIDIILANVEARAPYIVSA